MQTKYFELECATVDTQFWLQSVHYQTEERNKANEERRGIERRLQEALHDLQEKAQELDLKRDAAELQEKKLQRLSERVEELEKQLGASQ